MPVFYGHGHHCSEPAPGSALEALPGARLATAYEDVAASAFATSLSVDACEDSSRMELAMRSASAKS
jgi:hypothetical protein